MPWGRARQGRAGLGRADTKESVGCRLYRCEIARFIPIPREAPCCRLAFFFFFSSFLFSRKYVYSCVQSGDLPNGPTNQDPIRRRQGRAGHSVADELGAHHQVKNADHRLRRALELAAFCAAARLQELIVQLRRFVSVFCFFYVRPPRIASSQTFTVLTELAHSERAPPACIYGIVAILRFLLFLARPVIRIFVFMWPRFFFS